ncbi:hypothetical protein IEQ44_12475 [Nocardioides sp. Y6]|uniref:DUF3592 domain-containing protein n=1 Tax=Nocardioides malaquae TaxID=2773426 RepID=A0ABR9RV68_9ACTN|nr:hypothetical protein [Nocardioides malaquae]
MAQEPRVGEERRRWPWRLFVVHAVGWLLLGAFVASFGALVVAGSGEARPGALEQRLLEDAADGRATTLWVDRPFDLREGHEWDWEPGDGSWSAVVEVRWREWGLLRHTDYLVASSERKARRFQRSLGHPGPVVVGDPDALPTEWTQTQSRIVVEPWERDHSSTGSVEIFDAEWIVPSWAATTGLVVGVTTFAWLVVGPQPWRFTRWGWFWLVFGAGPVGVPAFLLFGGSSGLFPPADPARRLSGWSGFGLSVVTAFGAGLLLNA